MKKFFGKFVHINYAPDDGAGAGGSDGGDGGNTGDPKPEDKRYTEADVQKKLEQSMTRWRKSLQKDNKAKEDEIAALKKTLEEVQAKLEAAPPDPKDTTVEGQMKLMEQRHQRALQEIDMKLKKAEQERTEAQAHAMETTRKNLIINALRDAGCNNMKVGERYLAPDVYFDEVDTDWRLRLDSGETVPVTADYVRDVLPDHLKQALGAGRGGAGSTSGAGRLQQTLGELDKAKKQLTELLGKQGATEHDVSKVFALKRTISQLEAKAASERK